MQSLLKNPFTKWWVSYFILILGLVTTILATIFIIRASESQDRLRFSNSTEQIQVAISESLDTYTALLHASAGLFDASERVTLLEFKNFADRLRIRKVYPGIQGIGYAQRVSPFELGEVTSVMRDVGFPTFQIHPVGERGDYYPILFLEPQDRRNIAAIGYDMYSEPVRRAAMNRARDTGVPAITGRVVLVQEIDAKKQPGFLIYVPLYSQGDVPTNIEERRNRIIGYAYSPFRSEDFFNGILEGKLDRGVDFQVYDGRISSRSIFYDSSKMRQSLPSNFTPSFTDRKNLSIAGKTWVFTYSTRPSFDNQSEKEYVPFVFFGGLIMSIVLFSLSQLQYAARRTAELHSDLMRKSETALQKSNNTINNILESVTDGFIAFDKKWRFTYVNHEASRTLGRPVEELLGKNVWKEIPELEKSTFGKLYKRALRLNKPMAVEDYFKPFSAWFSVKIYPSKDGLSIYFQNITERKEQERRKDEFISIASHELKTPITSIKAFTQLLHKKFGKHKSAELYLTRMNEQINKLTILINDLLDVSRIQAGKIELRKDHFSLTDLLRNTIATLVEISGQRVIRFEKTTDVIVYGDEDRIGQVIINLINNAIKYSAKGRPIDISLYTDKKHAVVAVRDFGRGIDKQYIKKIFERFFRVAPSEERVNSGLGMGLYISAQIIKRHNGEIWVESSKNEGSTFYFSLPMNTPKRSA